MQIPLINTSVTAINAQPVELDGVPTSPQEQELKRRQPGGNSVLSPTANGVVAGSLSETVKGTGHVESEVNCT